MTNKLTYVSSGTPYLRIAFKECVENPELKAWINDTFTRMQRNKETHDYGVLYNAWVEASFGAIFRDHFKSSLACVQADSGGLQIITRGMTITDELKRKIYVNQGSFSDMAMSFDEIPLAFSGVSSSRLDLSNRWFDSERFEHCASTTGKNIYEQILEFDKLGSQTKPVFIVQGNCYDTYMRWADLALKEIPSHLHERIGGVAMGAAALGHGTLEDIQRAFIYTEMPKFSDENHMHLLAVGSVARLLPNLIFLQNGVYKDLHLTYDSTTHTSGVHMGRYYINNRNFEFPRYFDRVKWDIIYNDVSQKFDMSDIPIETFNIGLNTKSPPFIEKFGSRNKMIQSTIAAILSSIWNFMDHVDQCLASKKVLLDFARKIGEYGTFSTLYQVQTKDDFDHWVKHVGKHVASKPVASQQRQTLEAFLNDS